MRNIFHFVIVAFLIAFVSGCGYKASPYWSSAESGANSCFKAINRGDSANLPYLVN